MSSDILVIDNQNSVEPVVELALEDSGLALVRVNDGPAAKRRIVQDVPALIICNGALSGDADFGFRFCQELSGHGSFSQIPVMLLCERIDGAAIERATASGARGMIPWPIEAEALRMRLAPALPQLRNSAERSNSARSSTGRSDPTTKDSAVESKKASRPSERLTRPEPEPQLPDSDSKFKLAQQLLAKVLHSLKTSNLLEVIEDDEVPSALLEITKKVIAEYQTNGGKGPAPGAKDPSIDDVLIKKR